MEAISLKLNKNLLSDIDKSLTKNRYSTRTEFIRDAIRAKLNKLDKDEILKNISKLHGSSNKKTTDEHLHKAGDEAFRMIEKRLQGH